MAATNPAWGDALRLLARRELTAAELRRRLARRGHPPEAIEPVVAKLRALRYVDDERLAYNLARRRAAERRKGPQRVREELRRRGVAEDLAERAVRDAFPPGTEQRAVARAARRLAGSGGVPRDREGRERLARRLVRRGFPIEAVLRWLERGSDEPPPGDEDPA